MIGQMVGYSHPVLLVTVVVKPMRTLDVTGISVTRLAAGMDVEVRPFVNVSDNCHREQHGQRNAKGRNDQQRQCARDGHANPQRLHRDEDVGDVLGIVVVPPMFSGQQRVNATTSNLARLEVQDERVNQPLVEGLVSNQTHRRDQVPPRPITDDKPCCQGDDKCAEEESGARVAQVDANGIADAHARRKPRAGGCAHDSFPSSVVNAVSNSAHSFSLHSSSDRAARSAAAESPLAMALTIFR